jgi:hypothetical protein
MTRIFNFVPAWSALAGMSGECVIRLCRNATLVGFADTEVST